MQIKKTTSLSFAIKTPAPYAARANWGDFHFAETLKEALERLGHKARIDFVHDWYKPEFMQDDVAIVLRGRFQYKPQKGQITLLWLISHPEKIPYEELSLYHAIFIASQSYAALLEHSTSLNILPLLQCSDHQRFPFVETLDNTEKKGLFIGNSRNVYRDMVKWSVQNNIEFELYGQHWERFIPPPILKKILKAQSIDNKKIYHHYANAAFVLNDHWQTMVQYGFVSDRVYDVLACGGTLISDYCPSISYLFDDAVTTVKNEEEFKTAITHLTIPALGDRQKISDFIHKHHSFDQRAQAICTWLEDFKVKKKRKNYGACETYRPKQRHKVGLLCGSENGHVDSAALIRLVSPLTTEEAFSKVELIRLNDANDPTLRELDSCIVQANAPLTLEAAETLNQNLQKNSIPLYMDMEGDYSTLNMNEDTPIKLLLNNAENTWFSNHKLAIDCGNMVKQAMVNKTRIDPRLWRYDPAMIKMEFSKDKIRFLYNNLYDTPDHPEMIYELFSTLNQHYPDRFELLMIAREAQPMQAPWLKNIVVKDNNYPLLISWLIRNNSLFDVGFVPKMDAEINPYKSDLRALEYAQIGLLPMVANDDTHTSLLKHRIAIGCDEPMESWVEACSKLLTNPDAFKPMREAAFRFIQQERTVFNKPHPLLKIIS